MVVLLWAALGMFVVGNLFRVVRVAAMPVHLRWELYPIPPDRSGRLKVMAEEVLFLRAVWQHNRSLWLWSWLLHWALYLGICSAALSALAALSAHFARESRAVFALISVLSWISAVCGVSGTAGLVACRTAKPLLRMFTSRASLLNLAMIFVVFATGLTVLSAEGRAVRDMVQVTGAVMMLGPSPALSVAETVHLCMVALFLAYFPFTHMTHMYLKYFAFHSVRWDDVPLKGAPAMERNLSRSLDLAAHWSAPHIRAEGSKSWRQIAVEGSEDAAEKTRH